ncbi:hypothetical protein TSUD_09630 [Trifolium subterraneum]|nr:hypothetical protein TSUD_09630 [Trifolium subterraneum]
MSTTPKLENLIKSNFFFVSHNRDLLQIVNNGNKMYRLSVPAQEDWCETSIRGTWLWDLAYREVTWGDHNYTR